MLISVFILQNELKFVLICELEGFFVWRKVIKDPFRAVCAEILRYMNDFEVLSLKNNDYVTTMVLCYTGDVNRLNGLVNKIMRLKGVKKMRFIGF